MRVVLFTSQDIGNDVLTFLHGKPDLELTVVTQRTRRDEIYGYRSTFDLCLATGVPVLTPRALDEPFLNTMEVLAPDLVVCAYYPRIFPRRLLQLPRLGCINVHPGLLPHYRGTFPTPWCILNGEQTIGVTVHLMDEGIDTGDILVQRTFPILPDETGHELYKRSMALSARVLIESFDALVAGKISARRQEPGGSYYNRLAPEYRIDWQQSREHLCRQIRVHAKPYFPAYSFIFNKCVMINRARAFDTDSYVAQSPGRICAVFEDGTFVVACADGPLLVEEYDVAPQSNSDDIAKHLQVGNRFRNG